MADSEIYQNIIKVKQKFALKCVKELYYKGSEQTGKQNFDEKESCMLCKNCRQFVCFIIFSIVFSTNALPYKTNKLHNLNNFANQKESSVVSKQNGLTKITFELKEGNINMYLPDEMLYGDTISGTVFIAPKGDNDAEKQKNLAKINDLKIKAPKEFIDLKFASPNEESVSINNLPNVVDQANVKYINFSILHLQTDDKKPTSSVNFVLNSKKDRQISKFEILVEDKNYVAVEQYDIPHLGQVSRPINIEGEFDGDLTNTEFKVGNKNAVPFAESPRKTVFQSPSEIVGTTQVKLKELNTEVLQDFRNLSVNLSATKLNLLKGESSDLTIKVGGLEGITDEIPLNLNCTGSANMAGGNIQNVQISPNDVQSDGIFVQERNLIGLRTGNFNIEANVIVNAKPKNLKDEIVHVERPPKDFTGKGDDEKVWLVVVKTLDGKNVDIYFKGLKPKLQFCDWIQIKQVKDDEIDRNVVQTYQPVDDPTKPCTLSDQEVRIEGNPLKMPDGRWRINVKTQDGKTIYVRINSPNKPDLKAGDWIKLHKCKKIGNSEFIVDGYDKTGGPNKKPPTAPVKPTPTSTPKITSKPKEQPTQAIKPCKDGQKKNSRTLTESFEVLDEESTISMELSTDKGANDAKGMATWLRGIATLGGYIDVPEGSKGGAAVATAALKYLEVGADILSALGKSGLANKKVFEVKVKIFITTKKVTASCTREEVCVSPAWVKKKTYSETSKESNVRREIRIDETLGNDWQKIVDPSTRTFNPEKFEAFAKELLKKEIDKLKKNGEELDAFKKNCK